MAEQNRQPTPITDTPEFKKAVADAAAQAVQQLKTELLAGAAGQQPAGDVREFMSQLALAIGEISDQGTQRKRVAPEILAQRAKSQQRMVDLLLEARDKGFKPEYALIGKQYLNERFIEPFRVDPATKRPVRQEITWTGAPNEGMRPLNDIAKAIYREFLGSIGGSTGVLPTTDHRPNWVTPAGLVVKGDAPARRFVQSVEDFADDLGVKGGALDPSAPEIHVLGTIAPAARQNYLDKHQQPQAQPHLPI